MIHKTNAARLLDKLKIEYEILEYEVDLNDLSAVHVAASTKQDIKQIYKTIICQCEPKNFVVACLQGDLELDLKALAHACVAKRCELINKRPRKDHRLHQRRLLATCYEKALCDLHR